MDRPVYEVDSNATRTEDDFGHYGYVVREGDLKSEQCRLLSFSKWPTWSSQRPKKLAEAGLFYTGTGDKTKCAFCRGVLVHWNASDIPILEHTRLHPKCPFIQGKYVGNIPLQFGSQVPRIYGNEHHCHKRSKEGYHEPGIPTRVSGNVVLQAQSNASGNVGPQICRVSGNVGPQTSFHASGNVGPQICRVSGNVDFSREANRINSFTKWPCDRTQRIEDLARAGFYHVPTENKPDRVMCAYCKGKLYNWRFGDDPWIEHARCSPKCPYIVLCVGEDIIRDLVR